MLQMVGGCSRPSASKVSLEEFEPHRGNAHSAAAAPAVLQCPPAGSSMLQPSSATGHHKAVLTWKASASSPRPEDNAVGYCLYRSTTKGLAAKNAACSACEQINLIPIAGTGCVDDLVQDGALYYYVVTAVNAKRQPSSSSNEIPVQIPASKQSASSPASSYPLCRNPGRSQ